MVDVGGGVKQEEVEKFIISGLLELLASTHYDIYLGERSRYGCAQGAKVLIPNIDNNFHFTFHENCTFTVLTP